jgi:hypothetical protein
MNLENTLFGFFISLLFSLELVCYSLKVIRVRVVEERRKIRFCRVKKKIKWRTNEGCLQYSYSSV